MLRPNHQFGHQKFMRWASTAAGASSARLKAIVAAGVAFVMLAMAVACGNDSSSSPTPAASSAPTVAPTQATVSQCPDGLDCTTARDVIARLNAPDSAALLGHLLAQEFVCPGGAPTGVGAPFPLCEGAAQGEKRRGYAVSNSVTTVVDSADQLMEALRVGKAADGATWSLKTIGCPPPASSCGSRSLIVAVRKRAQEQKYFIFDTATSSGGWTIQRVTAGPLFQADLERGLLDGGTIQGDTHASVPVGTIFRKSS